MITSFDSPGNLSRDVDHSLLANRRYRIELIRLNVEPGISQRFDNVIASYRQFR